MLLTGDEEWSVNLSDPANRQTVNSSNSTVTTHGEQRETEEGDRGRQKRETEGDRRGRQKRGDRGRQKRETEEGDRGRQKETEEGDRRGG